MKMMKTEPDEKAQVFEFFNLVRKIVRERGSWSPEMQLLWCTVDGLLISYKEAKDHLAACSVDVLGQRSTRTLLRFVIDLTNADRHHVGVYRPGPWEKQLIKLAAEMDSPKPQKQLLQ